MDLLDQRTLGIAILFLLDMPVTAKRAATGREGLDLAQQTENSEFKSRICS
jgi:hypothetical protein